MRPKNLFSMQLALIIFRHCNLFSKYFLNRVSKRFIKKTDSLNSDNITLQV